MPFPCSSINFTTDLFHDIREAELFAEINRRENLSPRNDITVHQQDAKIDSREKKVGLQYVAHTDLRTCSLSNSHLIEFIFCGQQ